MIAATPRNPAIASFLDAVVRVEGASGVLIANGETRLIVTAWHVVKERPENVRVRHRGSVFNTTVLQQSRDTDLAILADDPKLKAQALALPTEDSLLAVGDAIHVAGFPAGWASERALLSGGTIAGQQDQLWLNADTTWGHSGGPACFVEDEAPLLAGIVLGPAGPLRSDLQSLVTNLTSTARQLGEDVGSGGGGFAVGTARGTVTLGMIAELTGRSLEALAKFGAAHFRTGYTRAASVSDIRQLLA